MKIFVIAALLVGFASSAQAATISNFDTGNPGNTEACTTTGITCTFIEEDAGILAPHSTGTIDFSLTGGTFGSDTLLLSNLIIAPANNAYVTTGVTTFGPEAAVLSSSANPTGISGLSPWVTESLTFTGSSAVLVISNLTPMYATFGGEVISSSAGAVVTASLSPVPLPAALPMFGAALAGLGFLAWRKKKNI